MSLLVAILLVLLILALVGGFALSKVLWIIAIVLLIALIWSLFAGRSAP